MDSAMDLICSRKSVWMVIYEAECGWVQVMNLIGDVKGKVAVMVDDMIDTAGMDSSHKSGIQAWKNYIIYAGLEILLSRIVACTS